MCCDLVHQIVSRWLWWGWQVLYSANDHWRERNRKRKSGLPEHTPAGMETFVQHWIQSYRQTGMGCPTLVKRKGEMLLLVYGKNIQMKITFSTCYQWADKNILSSCPPKIVNGINPSMHWDRGKWKWTLRLILSLITTLLSQLDELYVSNQLERELKKP